MNTRLPSGRGLRVRAEQWDRLKRVLVPLLTLVIFLAALYAIHRLLIDLSYERLLAELRAVQTSNLILAGVAGLGAYVAMTGYDWFALKYINRKLPYPTVALASFCGYAIANTVGFSLVTGGSVRYRLYAAAGLDGMDVVRITLFCALGFGFGVHVVGAAALAYHPEVLAGMLHMPPALLCAIGIAVVLVILLPVLATFVHHAPIGWGKWKFLPPSGLVSMGVLGISVLDVCFTGICLYVFLPPGSVPFIAFMVIFSVAVFAAVSSHVPGGLGVFESVILLALSGSIQTETLTAALIMYRAVYYLIPLVLATALMALRELAVSLAPYRTVATRLSPLNARVVPPIMAGLSFAGGLLLLISAATPVSAVRIQQLQDALPLFVVESAHSLSAVAGFSLLIVSRGLYRRLRSGYRLTLALFGIGAVLSVLKGLDYEVALVLAIMALVLATSRREFYREASLRNSPYARTWIATVVGAVVGMLFVINFSFKSEHYENSVWLTFDHASQMARSLRATVSVILTAGLLGFVTMRRTRRRVPAVQVNEDYIVAKRIIDNQSRTDPYLVLLDDKKLLFNDTNDAFLMYAIRESRWLALGDPVGPAGTEEELAWRFRELAEREGASVAFYQTQPHTFPLYVDMGLSPLIIGEEAIVDLGQRDFLGPDSPFAGPIAQQWLEAELQLTVLPPGTASTHWADLSPVAAAWLTAEDTQEKQFALGTCIPDYLDHFAIAAIRSGTRLVAFAALTITENKASASLDIIRHVADMPAYTLEYLYAQAINYCQNLRVKSFYLGLTPQSEIESHPLAPLWHQFGDLIYNRGEHFSNFQDLRRFKAQFRPRWEPRYFAISGGASPVAFVNDIASLITGRDM